jgi:hypothetical protein
MAEVTIPTGPSRALDVDRIAKLAEDALLATAREMRNQPVPTTLGVVYRKLQPPTVGYGGHRIPMPAYGRLLSEIRGPAQRGQEGIAFTDHLWEAGALPRTLSRDGDGVPDKDAWALFTWAERIEVPFLYLCNLSATRQLCETGTFQPWHVDQVETAAAARDIATTICHQRRSVKAFCPVMAAATAEDLSGRTT